LAYGFAVICPKFQENQATHFYFIMVIVNEEKEESKPPKPLKQKEKK